MSPVGPAPTTRTSVSIGPSRVFARSHHEPRRNTSRDGRILPRGATAMIRLPSLVLLLFISEAGAVFAQCPAGRWVSLRPMNEPRQELAAALLDEAVYAVGGLGGRSNANEKYDPATDRWSLAADYPIGTDHAWAVVLGPRLYVGGGLSNRVFSYDPAADQWTNVLPSTFVHGGTPAAGSSAAASMWLEA